MFKKWFKNREPDIYQQLANIEKYVIPFYAFSFIIFISVYTLFYYLKFEQFLLITTLFIWLILVLSILVLSPSLITALKILPKTEHRLLVSFFLIFGVILFLVLAFIAYKTTFFI